MIELDSPPIEGLRRLKLECEKASHVTLDVGTAETPAFIGHSISEREALEDGKRLYIAWNIDPSQHKFLVDNGITGPGRFAVNAPIESEAFDISSVIPKSSVNQVIVANVFGEPNRTNNYRSKQHFNSDGNSYHGSSSYEEKKQMLRKVYELTAPGGEIVIVESLTPTDGKGESFKGAVLEAIKASGYAYPYVIDKDGPEFNTRFQVMYGTRDIGPDSFIACALKLLD